MHGLTGRTNDPMNVPKGEFMHRRHWTAVASLCACLLAAGPAAAPTMATAPSVVAAASRTAQPLVWTSPLRIAPGVYSDVSEVVDSTNHVNLAAAGHGGVWYISDRGGSWTRSLVLRDLPHRRYDRVSIALDPHDRVYIAAERSACDECTPGSSDGIFLVSDKGRARGTFPSDPMRIAPPRSGEPSLKVYGGHIFLADVRPCCQPGPLPRVYLRTNASGPWTKARVARHGDAPALRIGSDGRPRVAFDLPRAIGYAIAHSVTGSFTVTAVPGTSLGDNLVGLALDAHDRPHLVWLNEAVTAQAPSGLTTSTAVYDWRTPHGWHGAEDIGDLDGVSNVLSFDLDTLGRPRVAAGGSSVLSFVRIHGRWSRTEVAASADVRVIALRRAFNGRAAVAWANYKGGLFTSRN
jgi:hypothetical protein